MDRPRHGKPIGQQDAFALRNAWPLDPAVTMLNHGSFGSCPLAVLRRQDELRAQLEREPVQFFVPRCNRCWTNRGKAWPE